MKLSIIPPYLGEIFLFSRPPDYYNQDYIEATVSTYPPEEGHIIEV